jgi:hypothetical protein
VTKAFNESDEGKVVAIPVEGDGDPGIVAIAPYRSSLTDVKRVRSLGPDQGRPCQRPTYFGAAFVATASALTFIVTPDRSAPNFVAAVARFRAGKIATVRGACVLDFRFGVSAAQCDTSSAHVGRNES